MGAVLSKAVSVICAQRACQRICRVGCTQQIAVALYGIFAFQHRNNDRTRGHEFNQTVKERLAIMLGVEAARLLNGQVAFSGKKPFIS